MPPRSFRETQEHFADLTGRAAAVYGLSPLLGRLYGVLLLSPAPLTLDALVALVGAAKSTVSVSMRTLERYRLVERHWLRGDRRDFYHARTDCHAILQDWYRLFALQELRYMEQAGAVARQALQTAPEDDDWPSSAECAVLLDRLARLDQLYTLFRAWADRFLGTPATIDPQPAEVVPIEVGE